MWSSIQMPRRDTSFTRVVTLGERLKRRTPRLQRHTDTAQPLPGFLEAFAQPRELRVEGPQVVVKTPFDHRGLRANARADGLQHAGSLFGDAQPRHELRLAEPE